jgi:hypothetical protein
VSAVPSYTHPDPKTGAEIAFTVDWGMPASRHYPAEGPSVHGVEITINGELIGPTETHEILSRISDRDLIEAANEAERDRADDAAGHQLNLQQEAS